MASKTTRTTHTRRDRRLAKASGFTREPRVHSPGKVGHQAGVVSTGKVRIDVPVVEEPPHRPINRIRGNFTTLGELLWSKGVELK